MKKIRFSILITLISVFLCGTLSAQMVSQPIKWSSKVAHVEGNIYEIQAIGVFDPGKTDWHIYDLGPYEDGPNPTALTVQVKPGVKLVGKTYIKTKVNKVFDQMFGMEIGICEGKAIVAQKVEVSSKDSVSVIAVIEWMTCNNGTCLPPTEKEFKIKLPAATGAAKTTAAKAGSTPATGVANTANQTAPASTVTATTEVNKDSSSVTSATDTTTAVAAAPQTAPAQPEESKSIWGIIIEAILWGFIALLTPCVFPMVPMTVSFFLKGSENKAKGKFMASMYGFFIIALYTLPIAVIIAITYFAGGEAVTADIFNWLATSWLPNILFFLIFMIFAASFFGAFEIVLPSWMVNKSDAKSDKGGLIGVFFMALTLVLVSFSCTGPIVGTILIKSTQGEIWQPIVTMLAFSTAFALPFTIFAFAPSLLKDLPKSGGWLNSVKVVLGFIEVALGFKFLSVADQTYHWGILDREVYLSIWIVVFTLLGLYLLGKLRFPHDDKVEHIGVGRLGLAIVSLSFVVYMIPGMWGAPLKALSGYMPPITTLDFSLVDGVSANTESQDTAKGGPGNGKYSEFLELPHGIKGFFEYKEAVEYAKSVNKPLFIDFTGHGCVNCREMESRVWSDPRVLKMLKEDFVVLALYADDKKDAAESDWITTESGRQLKSIGKINSHLAMTKFNVNAQPYYILLNPNDETPLVQPRGYDLDVDAFIKFLDSGKTTFEQK